MWAMPIGKIAPSLVEIERRLADRRARAARQLSLDHAFSWVRGGAAAAILVVWWLTLGPAGIASAWLLPPIRLFFALVIVHDGVVRRRRRADRSVAFYEAAFRRLEDRWAGNGETGERFLSESHPYAADLDVFGKGSLFELLCTARTRAGQESLADLLRGGGTTAAAARARQEAVAELRDRLDLREELALAGDDVRAGVDPELLRGWGTAPGAALPPFARPTSFALAVLNVLAAAAWWYDFGPGAFIVSAALAGSWALLVHHPAERPGRDLALLGAVLSLLERERFKAPLLVSLRQSLDTDGLPPSAQVRRL